MRCWGRKGGEREGEEEGKGCVFVYFEVLGGEEGRKGGGGTGSRGQASWQGVKGLQHAADDVCVGGGQGGVGPW